MWSLANMEQHFDYIVVGAGSAGCAAAYRLAHNSSASILLLESGLWDKSPLIKLPIGFAKMMGEGRHNWNYQTEPEPGLRQRQIPLPRGRVMGGCSAINGMVYIRGQAQDYDG
jgi:choline dehydrogenase